MKIFLLTNESSNQIALASRLHEKFALSGIIVRSHSTMRKGSKAQFRKILLRVAAHPISRAWKMMQKHYSRKYKSFPIIPILRTDDINAPAIIDLILLEKPDLVLVSGTNLLKKNLIETIQNSGKVMNLHTGLSPYVKGGPNCTNWCLSIGEPGLIGNSIMWIDADIDSGNLITTEQTNISSVNTLSELHISVMDHAHQLYIRAVEEFVAGRTIPDVDQDIVGSGNIFFTRQWTASRALRAVLTWNLIKMGLKSPTYTEAKPTCIALESSG